MDAFEDNLNWAHITRNHGYSEAFVKQAKEARAKAAKEEERKRGLAKYRGWKMPEWARQIVDEVAARRGVSVADMAGEGRTLCVVHARHEAMYLVKERKPVLSMPQIGGWFNRDHTVVGYALVRHATRNGLPKLSGFDLDGAMARNREWYRRRQDVLYGPKESNP